MRVYLKNVPAKFLPDLIRNDGSLGSYMHKIITNKEQQQDE